MKTQHSQEINKNYLKKKKKVQCFSEKDYPHPNPPVWISEAEEIRPEPVRYQVFERTQRGKKWRE